MVTLKLKSEMIIFEEYTWLELSSNGINANI